MQREIAHGDYDTVYKFKTGAPNEYFIVENRCKLGLPLSPLSGLVGQPITGHWTLRVADLAPVDVGTLNHWSVEIVPA